MKIRINKNKIGTALLALFTVFILVLSIRGNYGTPTETDLLTKTWRENGPFELSPERGRYALTYSVVENASVFFTIPIAQFTTPDVGYKDGKYVSLFAPGVSFVLIPGYLLGRLFNLAQVGTFATIATFAIFNLFLVRKISVLLGATKAAATLAALVFLFATPAYAYAVNLYQHHISTLIILLGVYTAIKVQKTWVKLSIIFFLCALSVVIDFPNFFIMTPLGLYAISKFVELKTIKDKINIQLKPAYAITVLAMILPVVFLLTFNKASYGDPFQLSGTVPSVADIDDNGNPAIPDDSENDAITENELLNPELQKKSSVGFFKTRQMLNGMLILLFGKERGVVVYTPVILLGVVGMYLLYKAKNPMFSVLFSTVTVNVLLYSMWGDPWGGWAFGARYLIPAYALLSICIAIFLTHYKRKIPTIVLFFVLVAYSVSVNTLGAITTSAIPTKGNAQALEQITSRYERYSYDRNWEYLNGGNSKAVLYKTSFNKHMSARNYYFMLVGMLLVPMAGLSITLRKQENAK